MRRAGAFCQIQTPNWGAYFCSENTIQISAANAAKETATGPITGYNAHISATGTKTSTPLIETPQSISVIGATEIRNIGAQSCNK